MKKNISTIEADAVATKTTDAYSADHYGQKAWRECCRALAERGYSAEEIEEVMRSKYTRWARDRRLIGENSAAALLRYLDDPDMGFNLAELMQEARSETL